MFHCTYSRVASRCYFRFVKAIHSEGDGNVKRECNEAHAVSGDTDSLGVSVRLAST